MKFKSLRTLSVTLVISTAALLSACSLSKIADVLGELKDETLPDVKTESLNTLDNAIDALNVNSSAWQSVLQDTVNKLTQEAQSTLRNEVQNVLDRGVATIGTEFRCNADFVGTRVRQDLQRIKAKLLNQPIPQKEPAICEVVPLAIDRALVPSRLNSVSIFGYDFDTIGTKATLKNGNQSVDISQHLATPTHYHMTLNLGSNGVPLTSASNHVILAWGEKTLSSISVIQPSTPVCEIKEVQFNRDVKITYTPPHTRGDRDYKGHGPEINSRVEWRNQGTHVDVLAYMKAKETKSDWTTAEGQQTYSYYTPPAGYLVNRIIGETLTTDTFLDSDHAENSRGMGPGGPVKTFIYRGDHSGSDAGSYTGMDIFFNPLRIELKQVGNCVAPDSLHKLQNLRLLSPANRLRLLPVSP